MIQLNNHVETIQKVLDVVKKTAYGIDFVILGIENQQKIHYAMPLRHMIGDAFSYLKEFNEVAAKNTKKKNWESADEFLSKFKKTDRLHPMITLCIYYGEDEWDGPRSLVDMLNIPEEFKPLVSDYKFNLVEVRKSDLQKMLSIKCGWTTSALFVLFTYKQRPIQISIGKSPVYSSRNKP